MGGSWTSLTLKGLYGIGFRMGKKDWYTCSQFACFLLSFFYLSNYCNLKPNIKVLFQADPIYPIIAPIYFRKLYFIDYKLLRCWAGGTYKGVFLGNRSMSFQSLNYKGSI